MNEKPTLIYIPPNVGGGSKGISIGGITTVRNLLEAFAAFMFSLLVMLIVKTIIPISLLSWIIVFVGLGFAFFCVMGVNGEPMSVLLLNIISYNNRRIFVTLRPPMPVKEEKPVVTTKFEQKIQDLILKNKKGGDQ